MADPGPSAKVATRDPSTARTAAVSPRPRRLPTALLLAALATAVVIGYRALPGGQFFQDDFVHMYDLANYGVIKLLVSAHGGHAKVLSNGTYAILHALFGWDPRGWFAAVLIVHVVNTLLLFALLRRYGASALVAFAFAALWALDPLQAGALEWFVTSGHVLVCTLTLLLLHDVARATARGTRISGARCAGWVVLGLAIASSYGIGGGIAAAFWIAGLALLPRDLPGRRRALLALAGLVVLVPAAFVAVNVLERHWYSVPVFYTPPALDLSPAALAAMVGNTIVMTIQLFVYGIVALLIGPLAFRSRWTVIVGPMGSISMGPGLILLAAIALGTIGIVAWALRTGASSLRSRAIGLAALALGGYGFIALGSALSVRIQTVQQILESHSVVAAALVQASTARHHYAVTMLLASILALGVEALRRRGPGWRRGIQVVLAATIALLAARLPAGIPVGEAPILAASSAAPALRSLEKVAAEVPVGSAAYVANTRFGLLKGSFFPGRAGLMAIYHPDGVLLGRRIRFVEKDPALLAVLRAQTGTPIASLVVSPDVVPVRAK